MILPNPFRSESCLSSYLGPYLGEATNAIFEMANRFSSIAAAIRQPGGLEPPLPPPQPPPPDSDGKGLSPEHVSILSHHKQGAPLSPPKAKQAAQLGLGFGMALSPPPPPAIGSRIHAHGTSNAMHEQDCKSAELPYSDGRQPSGHASAHYEPSLNPVGPSW